MFCNKICQKGKLGASLNYLVGTREQRWRHLDAERLDGLEVDRKFVLGERLRWQVGRLGALRMRST